MISPLIIRTVSALFLAPPLLWLLLAGSPFFLFLLALPVVGLLIFEWFALHEPFSLGRFLAACFGSGLLLLSAMPEAGMPAGLSLNRLPMSVAGALVLLIFFAEGVWLRHRSGEAVLAGVGWRFFGVMYCTLPLVLLLEVRHAEQGGLLICFLLLIIWATDVGAYFVGRRWGRRKLAPYISPGKTVAGFFGGLLLASVTGGGDGPPLLLAIWVGGSNAAGSPVVGGRAGRGFGGIVGQAGGGCQGFRAVDPRTRGNSGSFGQPAFCNAGVLSVFVVPGHSPDPAVEQRRSLQRPHYSPAQRSGEA
ncbi:MAG: phosphatidate cytidylyltransferase [Magnetococcus sp. YQC-3]